MYLNTVNKCIYYTYPGMLYNPLKFTAAIAYTLDTLAATKIELDKNGGFGLKL